MKNIPVTKPYFTDEINYINEVLQSGWVAQGQRVAEFEKLVASHEDCKYGIATSSCTTALHLLFVSLGIGKSDDVLVPSFTFIATPNSVQYTSATPVFVDNLPDTTFSVDPDAILDCIENKYSRKADGTLTNKSTGNCLKGIIAVHLFGLCANMERIKQIAEKYQLWVVEDSACALGARINSKPQGGFGVASCLSFHPRKSITTGEGGMILTSDLEMAEKLRSLRSHGASISETQRHHNKGYLLPEFNSLGFNFRLTDIQAAVGISQMNKIDWLLEEKRKKALRYNELISSEIPWLIKPIEPIGYVHTYQSYVCMLNTEALGLSSLSKANQFRNTIMEGLELSGVATRQGTHAAHTLGFYRSKYGIREEDYPNANRADKLSIALPLYPQMSAEDIEYVVLKLKEEYSKQKG